MAAPVQVDPDAAPGVPHLPGPGLELCGRYRIVRELGRGGMCAVFEATDLKLGREVALKLLLPRLSVYDEAVQRFDAEAHTLAALSSPHVVLLLDSGTVPSPSPCAGLRYMVLELLRGCDLYEYARQHHPLSPERATAIVLQACQGLAAAHAAGIVHRDLKPENLFIAAQPDGTELVKVLDFGIARDKQSGRRLTNEGAGVGSPAYMSPEQLCRASEADERSDIWSLGVVLYELLAARPPFDGQTPAELCAQILGVTPPAVDTQRRGVPAALAALVTRCLEREPDARFQNVAELAAALAPFADGHGGDAANRVKRLLGEPTTEHAERALGVGSACVADAARPSPRRHGAPLALLFVAVGAFVAVAAPLTASEPLRRAADSYAQHALCRAREAAARYGLLAAHHEAVSACTR